ncbi:Hint domain-containing protein [Primorskyibacter sp. 2E233]|uniref:Hint domain-containing protein n=1 Tax=Primorskyibacter sp. 2E233 TaxID=3413431 RepID=UPI003BF086AA
MPGYISEIDVYGGPPNEFIELAIPTGTDTSSYTVVLYQADGTIRQTLNLGIAESVQNGQDVYILDNLDGLLDINNGDAIAFVDDTGTVLQFLSFNNNPVTATVGPANGQTSTNMATGSLNSSFQSDDGGATYYRQDSPNKGTVPCYAPGTMIDTPDGPRAVETLRPGDLVSTVDHGPQPIRWVRSGDHPLEDAEVDDKPVLIQAGALGPNRPAQDLIVSPQHRIIVGGGGQLMAHFDTVAFAPAKALTSLPGIRYMKGKTKITYVHFACDRHEVVTANGCLSESLLLGPEVMKGLSPAERREVTRIFRPVPERVMH